MSQRIGVAMGILLGRAILCTLNSTTTLLAVTLPGVAFTLLMKTGVSPLNVLLMLILGIELQNSALRAYHLIPHELRLFLHLFEKSFVNAVGLSRIVHI